jgi:hypothetical protein
MVHILTINLKMKTSLVGVKVGGDDLKKIRAILLLMRPTTSLMHVFSALFNKI